MGRRLLSSVFPVLFIGMGVLYAQTQDINAYLDRGRALSKEEKYEQALPYYLLALEVGERQFGADSPSVVPLLNDLAEVYASRRNYGDAGPLLVRSLSIQERAIKQYQVGLARTLNSLGAVYEATEKVGEARRLYERVLTVWRPALGPYHPSVKTAEARLAKLPEVPPPAPVIAVPAPAGPSFRVHLTSIRDPARARQEWFRLVRLHADLLADKGYVVTRADLGAGRGVWYRVHAGPLVEVMARALCADFAARGVWCQVVRHRGAPAKPPVVADWRPDAPLPAGVAPDTGYRVHLTSIRNPDGAAAEWMRLKGLYKDLLGGLELRLKRADLGAGRGVWYRVQGGPLSKRAARARCAQFKARNVWCRVVPPGGDSADRMQRQKAQQVLRRVRGTRRPERRRRSWRRRGAWRSEPGARRFAAYPNGS